MANQLGRKRTLCEAYGAGGWDLRFEDMKRIGDWLYVLGVNTLDEHLSYITIRGARKRDHPQSFSYHEPWWDGYHVMAGYFTRLSLALSRGRAGQPRRWCCEPTTIGLDVPRRGEARGRWATSSRTLINRLEQAQVEYDIGCEDIIARHGKVDAKTASECGVGSWWAAGVRPRRPAAAHREPQRTDGAAAGRVPRRGRNGALLRRAARRGSTGRRPRRSKSSPQSPGWKKVATDEAIAAMQKRSQDGLAIAPRPRTIKASCSTTGGGWTTARLLFVGQHEHRRAVVPARSSPRPRASSSGTSTPATIGAVSVRQERRRRPSRVHAAPVRQPAAVPVEGRTGARRGESRPRRQRSGRSGRRRFAASSRTC